MSVWCVLDFDSCPIPSLIGSSTPSPSTDEHLLCWVLFVALRTGTHHEDTISLGVYKTGLVIVVAVNSCYSNGDSRTLPISTGWRS